MRRPAARPTASLAAAMTVLVAIGTLLGCAAKPVTIGTPTPLVTDSACAASGPASDAVEVEGALGATPVIEADGPFDVTRVERTVLEEGDGVAVALGDYVELAISIVNATTGDRAPGTATARTLLDAGSMQPGLLDTVVCSTVGSRIVGVVPSEDAYGAVGQPELSIGPEDDVVYVVDVLAVIPLQAIGNPVGLPDDFPAIGLVFTPDGRPSLRIPDTDPPPTRLVATLIEGEGEVVEPDAEFLIQFLAVNWRTGEVFDQTWGDAPRSVLGLVPGVTSAIVGSTVGSRIVVICPPADAFGPDGDPGSGILGTDTVVYVVDILAVTPAAPPAA